jgi:hypothetical protein
MKPNVSRISTMPAELRHGIASQQIPPPTPTADPSVSEPWRDLPTKFGPIQSSSDHIIV